MFARDAVYAVLLQGFAHLVGVFAVHAARLHAIECFAVALHFYNLGVYTHKREFGALRFGGLAAVVSACLHGGAVCFVAGGFVAGFVLRGGGLVAFAFSGLGGRSVGFVGLGCFGGALFGAFGLRFLAGDFAGFFYAAAVENLLGGGLGVAVGDVFLLATAFFGFAEFWFFRLPIVG